MLYELRIYHCVPGCLAALHRRFEEVTLQLWERLGIRPVGFWSTVVGSSNQTLTYLIRWESMAERESKWNAFISDPEWIAARVSSEKDGVIVEKVENQLLEPTAFSPMQ
jgi:hypothetical protein